MHVGAAQKRMADPVCFGARICPMTAFLGGVVAQEVVKFTGKFTPLHQFLYFDMRLSSGFSA